MAYLGHPYLQSTDYDSSKINIENTSIQGFMLSIRSSVVKL